MIKSNIFESVEDLPSRRLYESESKLLGFSERYSKVNNQLQLLLKTDELENWSTGHYGRKLRILDLLNEQYPLAIFYGDVGTGKTANAEVIANKIAKDARLEDAILFKLSNKVRGTGRVGEMGTLISQAFEDIAKAIGTGDGRAFLIIDEGDSLGASRSQENSHHEDKVGVNTLIQAIDNLRKYKGRIFVILCTNRLSILDPAVVRRASIIEKFTRPSAQERFELFKQDLEDLKFSEQQLNDLVKATEANINSPSWTYSDIRTRLYPRAVASAFPKTQLELTHFIRAAQELEPSPIMYD